MSRRRLFVYIGIVVSGAFALLGGVVFIVGILAELIGRTEPQAGVSLSVQFALTGLCLAAAMFALFFGLVAALIARQARERGAGYGAAYRLIESLRFREAVPVLERMVREGNTSSEVLMMLTSAYGYSGQFGKAQSTADQAVQIHPEDARSYITLATGYRLQGAYDEAASALRQALERDPEQAVVWAELGFVQRFAGRADDAIQSFERAARDPLPPMYSVRVNFHLTRAYQAQGDAERAVRCAARMMAARDGLTVWQASIPALAGTTYGTALRYEVNDIDRALEDAESGSVR